MCCASCCRRPAATPTSCGCSGALGGGGLCGLAACGLSQRACHSVPPRAAPQLAPAACACCPFTHTNTHNIYREAAGIVSMLPPEASFPLHVLGWLVATAWNCGMHHARFDRSGLSQLLSVQC
jgi:hypothetical protein